MIMSKAQRPSVIKDVWALVGCHLLISSSGFKGLVARGWVMMGGAGGHGYAYFEISPWVFQMMKQFEEATQDHGKGNSEN